MRLLVACPNCNRQFDATGYEPGARFRCHCGSTVTVQREHGHEAAVVRCSSCGAPCESGAVNCSFCGAEITLHDRDLNTVCPKCFARVSDRACFCHHCGSTLDSERVPGEATSLVCPACDGGQYLKTRMVAGVAVAECHACAGLWLTKSAFNLLARQASMPAEAVDSLLLSPARSTAASAETHEGPWRYRKCPECGILMNRRNYGPGSGVVVDMCRRHGIWFDAEELPAILDWIRRGGPVQTEQERTAERLRTERYRQALAAKPIGGTAHEHSSSPGNPILDFAHMLIELSRWF